jgi:hypothetical protein
MIDFDIALESVLTNGDEWQCWRALRLSGDSLPPMPHVSGQDDDGSFSGAGGTPSAGATGEGLCLLLLLELGTTPAAVIAADWLEDRRTPAEAWLERPEDVPGEVIVTGGGRVWATASATCALLAAGRDPGRRPLDLLRGEADLQGGFTGGAYPTFAAAAAFWIAEGPKTEMSEWGLRWSRETAETWWGPWEWVTALTFWGAARVPSEHPSVDQFLDELRDAGKGSGWPEDVELTLRALEMMSFFE